MALNESEILELSSDGNVSDLGLSSGESDDELDRLLQTFENDDFVTMTQNDMLESATEYKAE